MRLRAGPQRRPRGTAKAADVELVSAGRKCESPLARRPFTPTQPRPRAQLHRPFPVSPGQHIRLFGEFLHLRIQTRPSAGLYRTCSPWWPGVQAFAKRSLMVSLSCEVKQHDFATPFSFLSSNYFFRSSNAVLMLAKKVLIYLQLCTGRF